MIWGNRPCRYPDQVPTSAYPGLTDDNDNDNDEHKRSRRTTRAMVTMTRSNSNGPPYLDPLSDNSKERERESLARLRHVNDKARLDLRCLFSTEMI